MDMESRDSLMQQTELDSARWRISQLEARLAETEHRLAEETKLRGLAEKMLDQHDELFQSLGSFADSLREVRSGAQGAIFPPGTATRAWHDFLGKEITQIFRYDDAPAQSLELLREAFRDIEAAMMAANLKDVLERAKVAHLALKFEVYKVFMGLSSRNACDFAQDGRCFLGEQCMGCGKGRCLFQHPGRSDMESLYARFHDAAIAAVHCFRHGKSCPALDELARMEEASLDLLAWLSASLDGWLLQDQA